MQDQRLSEINPDIADNSISVGVPTLPPWGDGAGDTMVRDSSIAVGALSLAVLIFVRDLSWPFLSFVVITLMLSVIVAVYNRRQIKARNSYEQRLCEMTMALGEKNKALKELIQIDPLTELLNRRGLERALSLEMSRSRRSGTKVFALLIDCDDFKQVNDRFGHAVGDVVLQQIGKCIMASIRATDYGSRIGGDEFIVLLVDLNPEDVAMVAERVRLGISEASVRWNDSELTCTVSMGVAELPAEICTIEEVLTLARTALGASKSAGKNRITVSSVLQANSSQLVSRKELAQMVQTLVGGKGLRSLRQPIYRLQDQSVYGYEILTRGPQGPFEMPADLFRLARENDVLTALDMRCFKLALAIGKENNSGLRYHINLFPGTLLDIPLDGLREMFADCAGQICVEISEQQCLGRATCLVQHIEVLKECGITVALDDVGCQRSSLQCLLELDVDILKFHPDLVIGSGSDAGKRRQIERLLSMSQSIKADVIAEGIESQEDLDALIALGVHLGQGYRWGQPESV